ARDSRSAGAEVASLFGGAPGGKVLGTPGLPQVITEGASPVAAGLMSYAPHPPAGRAIPQARSAPVAAQPVGLRAARNRAPAPLTPARLDRSNFLALTTPDSMAKAAPASALGATIGALRPAGRKEASELLFGAPQGNVVVSELRPRT
ncbi:MAG: hypothetical protein K2Y29_06730, partial [Beijerinckiaceae bacterium]|nr:hypothetical protein [Beijerinckiaceae bacterium]